MAEKKSWRSRAHRGLEDYFRRRSFPRLMLSLVLILTGLAGFGLSYGLLRLGLTEMGLRYPMAVIGAYGVFLGLIRIWVEIEKRHFDPDDPRLQRALSSEDGAPAKQTSSSSWLDWLDVPTGSLDLDEGCLPAVLVMAVVGLVGLLVFAIVGAPVFLDAFLAAVLYRRLKVAAQGHWLGTAIGRTWMVVALTALLLGIGGWTLGMLAPGSQTLGQAIEHLWAGGGS
jgi:hypothetical protein